MAGSKLPMSEKKKKKKKKRRKKNNIKRLHQPCDEDGCLHSCMHVCISSAQLNPPSPSIRRNLSLVVLARLDVPFALPAPAPPRPRPRLGVGVPVGVPPVSPTDSGVAAPDCLVALTAAALAALIALASSKLPSPVVVEKKRPLASP